MDNLGTHDKWRLWFIYSILNETKTELINGAMINTDIRLTRAEVERGCMWFANQFVGDNSATELFIKYFNYTHKESLVGLVGASFQSRMQSVNMMLSNFGLRMMPTSKKNVYYRVEFINVGLVQDQYRVKL